MREIKHRLKNDISLNFNAFVKKFTRVERLFTKYFHNNV